MKNGSSADPHGRGLRGLDREGWVTHAEGFVLRTLDEQLAMPRAEVDARLWETGFPQPGGRPLVFFPHIIEEALANLVTRGQVELVGHSTKGGRAAHLYVPADTVRGRRTAIAAATRRKAMLYARYLGYSSSFGPTGEEVVRLSLADAARHGYTSINLNTRFGEVRQIGTARLAGALDSGAWLTTIDPIIGLPLPTHGLLVEVKNIRQTLYPRHEEVHQLLHKAAVAQNAHPELPLVPLLVCRRAHDWLFWMAKDLGFLVHAAKRQFLTLPPKTEVRYLDEIKAGLGFTDLTVATAAEPKRIESLFTGTLPKTARATAVRWAAVGSKLTAHFATLRKKIKPWERKPALAALRTDAEIALDQAGVDEKILAWALEEDDDEGHWEHG
jgi:hypothetical protein